MHSLDSYFLVMAFKIPAATGLQHPRFETGASQMYCKANRVPVILICSMPFKYYSPKQKQYLGRPLRSRKLDFSFDWTGQRYCTMTIMMTSWPRSHRKEEWIHIMKETWLQFILYTRYFILRLWLNYNKSVHFSKNVCTINVQKKYQTTFTQKQRPYWVQKFMTFILDDQFQWGGVSTMTSKFIFSISWNSIFSEYFFCFQINPNMNNVLLSPELHQYSNFLSARNC